MSNITNQNYLRIPATNTNETQQNTTANTETQTDQAQSPKPSIFQRAWQSVTLENVAKAVLGLVAIGGFAAAWIFMPALALPMTVAIVGAIAGRIATVTIGAQPAAPAPAPAPQTPNVVYNLHIHQSPSTSNQDQAQITMSPVDMARFFNAVQQVRSEVDSQFANYKLNSQILVTL